MYGRDHIREVVYSLDNANTVLDIYCPMCEEVTPLNVRTNEFVKWINGELIQYAMPSSSAADRDRILNGLHEQCFDKFLGIGSDD